jgi:uncharacterized integral membrane protein
VADDEFRGGGGPSAKLWGILVLVVLAVVFIALNSQEVKIDFLVGETTAPLVFALVISTLLGFVIGYLIARIGRGGHRE